MPTPESVRTFFLVLESSSSLRKAISLAASALAFFELDARVHVLGVFAEDDDVHALRVLHRAGNALVVLDRPHAGVEVEQLAQRHIQRADAAAHRRRQRPFDGDAQIARRGHRVVGQPFAELPEGLLAGEDLKPADRPPPAIGLLDRGVKDPLRGLPDVPPRAVAFDKRDDGMVGRGDLPVAVLNRLAVWRQLQSVVGGLHALFCDPPHMWSIRGYHLQFGHGNGGRGKKGRICRLNAEMEQANTHLGEVLGSDASNSACGANWRNAVMRASSPIGCLKKIDRESVNPNLLTALTSCGGSAPLLCMP